MKTRSLITVIAIALTSIGITAPAEAATFTWSSQPLTNLKAEGALINGGFTTFPTTSGLYIQQCAAPAVAGERPTNCIDLAWVSSSGAQGTTSPKGGISFTLKANFNGKQSAVNCLATECGLFFRLDHLASQDKSEDTYLKISFAASVTPIATLAPDEISVTLNGAQLTKNVPVNLGYRAPAKIVATSTSGLAVTVVSATPDCSYQNGILTALKGSGVCAINVSTAGDAKFDPARANFPFMLTLGKQQITRSAMVIAKGKTKALPTETNFGQSVTYTSNSKKCRVESNLVEVNGPCVLTAKAAGKADMWEALTTKITIKNK